MTVQVGPGRSGAAQVEQVTDAVAAALDGAGPALAVGPPSDERSVPEEVALVVPTSGSTGEPRRVLLEAHALRASADATHARLGGAGRWLLALPLTHVAGLQVLVRSLRAGTRPVVVGEPADPAALAAAVESASGYADRLYTSLVPTQLRRALDDTRAAATLRRLDAILVGGAAVAPDLVRRARDAGLRVVRTYGMTETCGGCVYDGLPLDGVTVAVRDGRVELAGPVLARGYLADPAADAAAFVDRDGVRTLRTSDLGRLDGDRLEVLGRADDVLVTGGENVAPAAVERVIGELGVGPVCVVGVPDPEWGQLVVAVVVAPSGRPLPTLDDLRRHVARTLGPAAAPRRLVLVDGLPERGPGKVDRAAVARLAAARTGGRHGDGR